MCQKEKSIFTCDGCSNKFCKEDLAQHLQNLGKELDEIENDYDEFTQKLKDKKSDAENHSLIEEIDKWEDESINKIKQTAEECRQQIINSTKTSIVEMEKQFNDFAQKLKEVRKENDFNDTDVNRFKENLSKLQEELSKPSNISIEKESSRFIARIFVILPSEKGNKILFKRPVQIP